MTSPSAGKRRKDTDVMKLIESNYDVTLISGLQEFYVKFNGPKNTPYERGKWNVRVCLPDNYPFEPPMISFMNKIFHPNIDETTGSVCLDVINQAWRAVFDLANIFETFLPQLLTYPNPTDPLNGAAGALFLLKPLEFQKKVEEHIKKYASEEVTCAQEKQSVANRSESPLSDLTDEDEEV